MRIFTTLLALLLASPVFAETYVCSVISVEAGKRAERIAGLIGWGASG